MPKPAAADLYAWESHIEPAVAGILRAGGIPVLSPFFPDQLGQVEQQLLKEKHCIVRYEPDTTDPNTKAFATAVPGIDDGIDSIEAGWGGTLLIEHSVPVDDQPPEPGMPPGCYAASLRLSGQIRALILSPHQPLQRALPFYDFLFIRYQAPRRGIDQPRGANTGTELFRLSFMPARGMF